MKENKQLEYSIFKVWYLYTKAPIELRITVGKVLAGDIKIKKSDE